METIHYTVNFGDELPAEGPLVIPEERAWYPPAPGSNAPINWWQYGGNLSTPGVERANAVYACRKVLSEEVARLTAHHYLIDEQGGKVRQRSTLERVLRYPNSWQSRVDFWLNMMDSLLRDGNAYALASRDGTGAISALTPVISAHPYVDPIEGDVFYAIGLDMSRPLPDAERIDPAQMVPASEVLHLRLFTPVHALMGESPLVAAAISAQTGSAITMSTHSFFNRGARPSGILRHPKQLKKETRDRLRDAWTRTYSGSGTGGTAVLEEGVEWQALTMSAVDAEVIDNYRLTVEDIARVFRVPLFMLGSMDKATFNNVEQMTRSFLQGGLGFYLENIEAKIAQFFRLPMNEVVEFDLQSGLLRTEFRDRIEALTRGVQGGVFTPNEARRSEGLPAKQDGDEPFLQAQMVPLSYAANQEVSSTDEPAPTVAEEEPMDESETRAMVRRMMKVA